MVVPANLTSVAESDLTPRPIATGGQKVAVTAAGAQPDAHNDWAWVLALVALGFIVLDVWYLTRVPRIARPAPAAFDPRPRMPERKAS